MRIGGIELAENPSRHEIVSPGRADRRAGERRHVRVDNDLRDLRQGGRCGKQTGQPHRGRGRAEHPSFSGLHDDVPMIVVVASNVRLRGPAIIAAMTPPPTGSATIKPSVKPPQSNSLSSPRLQTVTQLPMAPPKLEKVFCFFFSKKKMSYLTLLAPQTLAKITSRIIRPAGRLMLQLVGHHCRPG